MGVRSPLGFLSYVHNDDTISHGYIGRLRVALEGEVQARLADDGFAIFHDRDDIAWGQQWRDRLAAGVDGAVLFLPVVTPRYFRSEACRDELTRFLAHEQALGRTDLVLPIYLLTVDSLDEHAEDPLMRAIAAHQWMDWRHLRREPMTGQPFWGHLDAAAERIKTVLRSFGAAPPAKRPPPPRPPAEAAASDGGRREGKAAGASPPPPELPTLVVDAMGRGDHPTIGAAIAAAPAGARLLVRPGHYNEALVLDKPLEIIGDGEPGEVEVAVKDKNVLIARTGMGRIENLTLRQLGGAGFAVWIARGRIEVIDCDITSRGFTCVAIAGGANPVLRGNRIHDGSSAGILVHDGGRGLIENNDVVANGRPGMEVRAGGDPIVRGNRIHDGKQAGIHVHSEGRGTFEDNDVFANAYAGMEVKAGGDPIVRGNRIHDGKQAGIHVHSEGRGTFEDNEIVGNRYSGIAVKGGGDPTVRGNRIHGNREGIWVREAGGTFTGNTLTGNNTGAWDLDAASAKRVVRKDNIE